jgi:peptidoglycan/xylan/chitin deacetylase (PgdA/CDA1 family)
VNKVNKSNTVNEANKVNQADKGIKYKRFTNVLVFVFAFLVLLMSIATDVIDIYDVMSRQKAICVPIIMYHHVKNTGLGKDVISPYEFERDLIYLTENNYNTITMTELIDYVYYDAKLPENPIILTFDDGLYNTYKNVFPLLKKYNKKIVLSIIGKSVDDFSRVNDKNISYAHITWDELREMADSGLVEIQNHSYNLHKVSNGRYGCYQKKNESLIMYEEFLSKDILTLQDKIKEAIEFEPNTFTYPYGRYNNNTDAVLKKLGFKATLSVTFGVNLITKDPDRLYDLKRICRSHNQSIEKMIKEGMETLKYIRD